jgi:hypothetical protein
VYPFPSPQMGAGATKMVYRSQASTSNSLTVSKPASVAVGDVVFLIGTVDDPVWSSFNTTSGSAWTDSFFTISAGAARAIIAWKVLNSTDVANGWTATQKVTVEAIAFQGNGASAVALKQALDDTASTAATTVALTPFTPSAVARGMVTGLVDTDANAPTRPAGTNSRLSAVVNSRGRGFADNEYYGGGALTWTVGTGGGQAAWSLEIT